MQQYDRQPNMLPATRPLTAALSPPAYDIAHLPQPLQAFLERTNCVIDLNEISLVNLVEKIEECSRRLSLQVMFWSQPKIGEPVLALLLSEDYVWIRVIIWRTGYHHVTVEIRKRDGDYGMYQLSAQQLLDGVCGELPDIVHKVDDFALIKRWMQAERDFHAAAFPGLARGRRITPTDNLGMVYGFLRNDGPQNPRRTGLELLVGLANPRKASIEFSVLFSRVMLIGTTAPGTESREAREMQFVILDIIQNRPMAIVQPYEMWNLPHDLQEGMHSPALTSRAMHIMVMLALTVLDNCLETCLALEPYDSDSAACMPALLVNKFLWHASYSTGVNLISTLLTDIQHADENAQIARVATSCLRRMCIASEAALQETMRLNGKAAVERAHAIGKLSHAKLEWECEQFLSILVM